jgi:UDP-glucose 4-epimerase
MLRGTRVLVTGGAGFIGSHCVEALVAAGAQVRVLDNLSSGDDRHLAGVAEHIEFIEGDVGDAGVAVRAVADQDAVWHLAANPEVRTGATDPTTHVAQNVTATATLLEAVRGTSVQQFLFTSTSTVYGNAAVRPTPEDYGPLLPISVYGGCKLACEGLISAYASTFDFDALMFRFANVVGPRSNHGVTYDFVHKLRRDPAVLEILGDGTQTKSYVSVRDTVAGMLRASQKAPGGVQAYNIGSLDAIPVTRVAEVVADVMGLAPRFRMAGGTRDGAGWTGDVKHMALGVDRLQALGWMPQDTSADAIAEAARALVEVSSSGRAGL